MKRSPSELAERRVELSAEFGQWADELADILEIKANAWKVIRENTSSDKSADREWEATPEGIKEMRLRLKMKSAEKKMSAAKTYLEVLNTEARNLY